MIDSHCHLNFPSIRADIKNIIKRCEANGVNKLLQEFNVTLKHYLDNMEIYQIDKALKNIFEYLSEVNAYVDEQAPWALKKTDTARMQDVLYVITLITIKCSVLLQPVIPLSLIHI